MHRYAVWPSWSSVAGPNQDYLPAVERETKSALDEAHYTSLEEAVKDARTEIEHREK
jgi:hypothetical protein